MDYKPEFVNGFDSKGTLILKSPTFARNVLLSSSLAVYLSYCYGWGNSEPNMYLVYDMRWFFLSFRKR
jgi:hypothetical protein